MSQPTHTQCPSATPGMTHHLRPRTDGSMVCEYCGKTSAEIESSPGDYYVVTGWTKRDDGMFERAIVREGEVIMRVVSPDIDSKRAALKSQHIERAQRQLENSVADLVLQRDRHPQTTVITRVIREGEK